jgi:hypothetical protein
MKNNQKCVRMSDEVLKVVEGFRGEGFNEKFENLVMDFRDTLSQRLYVLDQTNKMIEQKQKQLKELENRIWEMKNLESSLSVLMENAEKVAKILDRMPIVSQIETGFAELQLKNEIQSLSVKNVSQKKCRRDGSGRAAG